MKKILVLIFLATITTGCVPKEDQKVVKLYYYNAVKDQDADGNILCSKAGLEPVQREISVTQNQIQDTISLLLKGELTAEEKSNGLSTEYPLEGFNLKNSILENGLLTLEFSDPNNKTVGGSCRVAILWLQIEETAKQFPEVQEVQFKPEELFQP